MQRQSPTFDIHSPHKKKKDEQKLKRQNKIDCNFPFPLKMSWATKSAQNKRVYCFLRWISETERKGLGNCM